MTAFFVRSQEELHLKDFLLSENQEGNEQKQIDEQKQSSDKIFNILKAFVVGAGGTVKGVKS